MRLPAHGVLLTIAYDGAQFSGSARQTARTVSGELDGAIGAIDPRATPVRVASRTDAGVHARGQVCAFDTDKDLDPRNWTLALLMHMSREIGIVRAARIAPGFEPSRRALEKTYRYVMFESQLRDPFLESRAWRVGYRLNHELMRQEADALIGEHDFRAFRGKTDTRTDTVRKIVRAELRRSRGDARCLELTITGNRFLYRMVRIITGTLVDVGRGHLAPGAIRRALASGSRDDLGVTAPPDGLYLDHVLLEDEGWDAWPVQHSSAEN